MSFPFHLLENWFSDNEKQIQEQFFHFLRFPSISTDPKHKEDCLGAANFLVSYLEEIGMESQLLTSTGLPVVFAENKKENVPVVLLYHHYDVQPVDPLSLWHSDPFSPVFKEGKVFARGASDNKGQCFLTLTALKALHLLKMDLPLHIKLFIEGEEESGGEGTAKVIASYSDKLEADFLCAIDFDIPDKDTPALLMGYRGLLAVEIECINAKTDLHSGAHGGIALNPNHILIEVLSKLWDEKGKVCIPHFYDGVEFLSDVEKELFDFSFDSEKYRKEFGVGAFCKGDTPLKEANGSLPTVEINGVWGGYTGEGFKTVIPAKAFAKLSCRLVPDQDPENILKHLQEFLLKNTPEGAEMKIKWHHGAKAFRSCFSSQVTQIVRKSMEETFKKSPCRCMLTGGSVPIIRDLAKASQAEVALFGFALDTDNIHAPNEHFEWECFKKGFMTVARVLWEMAKQKKTC